MSMPDAMYEKHIKELREDRQAYAEFCVEQYKKKVIDVFDKKIKQLKQCISELQNMNTNASNFALVPIKESLMDIEDLKKELGL